MIDNITTLEKEYLTKLIGIVTDNVRGNFYDENLEIAKFATDITNSNNDEYVLQFKQRESEEQKKQRLEIYKSLTGYASSQIRAYFKRVLSVDASTDYIATAELKDETIIRNKLKNFYRDKDALTFSYELLEQATFNDPNMLLLINSEFIKDGNGKIIDSEIYPTIFFSPEIIYRENRFGKLDFAVIERERQEVTIDVRNNIKKENVKDFYLFRKGFNIVLRGYVNNLEHNEDNRIKIGDNNYYFEIDRTKIETCPLIELGVYSNTRLGSENYISPLHFAKDLLIDLINSKSEHDLTKTLHAFLQRVQYISPCDFENEHGSCNGGQLNGHDCPSCKGSGIDTVHQSSQDALYMLMPDDTSKMIDVKNLAGYIELPIETPKFQAECIDKILEYISNSIFSYNIFKRSDVQETAAGVHFESDKIQSTLLPFANRLAHIYNTIRQLTGNYCEIELITEYEYPKDLKLRTKDEILLCYQTMRNAQVPTELLEAEEQDLLNKIYRNNPEKSKNIMAFRCHKPLRSKTNEQALFAISSLALNHPTRVLWTYFDDIVVRITKQESTKFYLLKYDRQKELIDIEVQKIIQTLPSNNDDNITFNINDDEEE